MIKRIKTAIGKTVRPFARSRRLGKGGQGGSAQFAGMAEEWSNPYRPGGILLGQSLRDRSWQVGLEGGKHLVTIGASGSGKGRTRTIPTLLRWPHSAIVIDVKGTHAAVTGYARGAGGGRVRRGMGQDVLVLNPFNIHAGQSGMPPSCRFNPLTTVDINAVTVYEDIDVIADALVVPSTRGDNFWDEGAKSLIRGLIGHVLTHPDGEIYGRNLNGVRLLLTRPDGPPLKQMEENQACGGLIREVGSQMQAASEKVFSDILATAIQHTAWLASPAMQDMLSVSHFDLMDLKRKPTTLYLVIPPEYLAVHSRFLRLLVNLALKVATRVGSSGVPLLFLLDEFFSCGRLDLLASSAANCRSYSVVLFIILQAISQLRIYGDDWENFIANAGAVEFFGVNDLTTARYAADLLGHKVVTRKDRDGIRRPASVAPLRDYAELVHEIDPRGGRMMVFRGGPDPFLLKRLNYDRLFRKSQYNPDPDIKGS